MLDELDEVVALKDWPQPAVVTRVRVLADDVSGTAIRYRTEADEDVIVRFSCCYHLICGEPNDEALEGHPLYGRGLKCFGVHEVRRSSLLATLERRNAVHRAHDREWYLRDKKHYVFTFKERTVECIVKENDRFPREVTIFADEEAAERSWRAIGEA
jgi:hypothetical protein